MNAVVVSFLVCLSEARGSASTVLMRLPRFARHLSASVRVEDEGASRDCLWHAGRSYGVLVSTLVGEHVRRLRD